MLADIILGFLAVAALGCLFNRSCEICEEQAERKRIEKIIRKRYRRTF